jgi:hypothetical protein
LTTADPQATPQANHSPLPLHPVRVIIITTIITMMTMIITATTPPLMKMKELTPSEALLNRKTALNKP